MRSTLLLGAMLISASMTAQETVTVSTAPGNSEQRYYSLQNGTQATTLLSDWDLAFESTGITGAILLNTASRPMAQDLYVHGRNSVWMVSQR